MRPIYRMSNLLAPFDAIKPVEAPDSRRKAVGPRAPDVVPRNVPIRMQADPSRVWNKGELEEATSRERAGYAVVGDSRVRRGYPP